MSLHTVPCKLELSRSDSLPDVNQMMTVENASLQLNAGLREHQQAFLTVLIR